MFYAIELIVLLAALMTVAGYRIRRMLAWTLTAAGLAAFATATTRVPGNDLYIFWRAGQNVWKGDSPYDLGAYSRIPVPLNPPTAFPLFAAFALLPFRTCLSIWTILNVVACIALVGLSTVALRAEVGSEESQACLDPPSIGILSSAVALSFASRYGIGLGQFSILTAIVLIGAIFARAKRLWFVAAICLAVATIKPGTMLPFLLLFCGRGHWKTVVAWSAICLALVLVATAPAAVPVRLREMADGIARYDISVNNYEYRNPSSVGLLGIDHLLYRLGLRDRGLIRAGQALVLAALGFWMAFEAVRPNRRLPGGTIVSLVVLYAMLFFYHRFYDAVLLALPLAHVAGRARLEQGRARILLAVAGIALFSVLYLRVGLLGTLTAFTLGGGLSAQVVQVTVLPYATWSILLAMACLALVERRSLTRNTILVG